MTAQPNLAPPAARLIETSPASQPDLALPGFEHRFATVGGVRLHYVTGGKVDGEVIVLLAGFPESWFAWRKMIPLLAPNFRIIAPDLPGQGDSDRPQGGYDTQALAAAVHGLLQQLGVDRYCMAAHDVGAWVAYPYAALFGQRGSALGVDGRRHTRASPCRTRCRLTRNGRGAPGTSRSTRCRTCRSC